MCDRSGLSSDTKASVDSRSAPASIARWAERWITGPSVTTLGNGTASSSQSTPWPSNRRASRPTSSNDGSPAFRNRISPEPSGTRHELRRAKPLEQRERPAAVECAPRLAECLAPVGLEAARDGERRRVQADALDRGRGPVTAEQRGELTHGLVAAARRAQVGQ